MHAGLLKTRRSTVVWLMGIAVGASALYGTTAQALDKATGPVVLTIEGYRFLMRRLQGEASLLSAPDEGLPVEPLDRPERFLVRKLGREFLVAANDIEWLQASGNYVNLRVRGHDYPMRSTIGGIAVMGINGFVIGPLIAALFIACWNLLSGREHAGNTDEIDEEFIEEAKNSRNE